MAADDFALVPVLMTPKKRDFANIQTESESDKKEYLNMSTTPVNSWICKFMLSDANYATFISHYNGRYGGYDSFSFTGVPAYISGSPITGRWVDKSLKENPFPNAKGQWEISVEFEKEN